MIRLRGTLVVCALGMALGTGGQPLNLDCRQEVRRQAKAPLVVRSSPSAAADSVGAVPKDSTVSVQMCSEAWCHVRYGGLAGFALDSLLEGSGPQTRPGNPPPPRQTCCRVCTTGKACGNSCIARNRSCRQPPGCACNGQLGDSQGR
jgi:hypothetical protein